MNRDQLRQHIDTLELLSDVTQAIEDVQGVEFEPDEKHVLRIEVTNCTPTHQPGAATYQPISFLHNLPPDLLLVGLRAIEQAVRLEAAQTQLTVAEA